MTLGSSMGARWSRDRRGLEPFVVAGVLGQDGAQVRLAEDQHPVGAFGACRAYLPLGKGVGPRRRLHLVRVIGIDVPG